MLALAAAAPWTRNQMRTAPSADRNAKPISDLLSRHPPFSAADARHSCLEIASGTGQHCAHLARVFPHVVFQPTEYSAGSAGPEASAYGSFSPLYASIVAHCGGMPNVRPPLELDGSAARWADGVEGAAPWDAIYACNVCHISPYAVSEGIIRGAARLLGPGGHLFIYGPFMVDGQHTAPSNVAFDERLRAQNPAWGVRDATVLAQLAESSGLRLVEKAQMPANNFVLVFGKIAPAQS